MLAICTLFRALFVKAIVSDILFESIIRMKVSFPFFIFGTLSAHPS